MGQVAGQVVQAGHVGSVHFHTRATWGVTPDQLPRAPAGFVGRDAELAELDRIGAAARGPLVLTGIGGAGKSALAVRWLAGLPQEDFDGSLFAMLGGPAAPFEILEWFLISLGVPPERIPLDEGLRASLYRSVTAGKRLRLLLDDAVSARQVRPLLPAGDSIVVVTSRSLLSGLAVDGAQWVQVGPLRTTDSVRLLESVIGRDRVAAEPGAADALGRLCGGLPLALSVVGARLATRARRPLQWEVHKLGDERERLAGLDLGHDLSVGAALDLSVRDLPEPLREAYRVCAWHPGREFGVPVVAAGADIAEAEMAARLEDLLEAGLVAEVADERYALHDLVRLHGRGAGGSAVVRTMVEWYLDRSVAAELAVHPLRPRIGPRFAEARATDSADQALKWAERERTNVRAAVEVAADQGWDDLVWQFCEALWGRFLHTRRYAEWIDLQRLGINSARRCEDARAEGRLRNQLAYAYAQLGEVGSAAEESARAMELARRCADGLGEATAWEQLGLAVQGSDPDRALHCFRRSRDLNARLGRVRGVALCRRRIGEVLADQGDLAGAAGELTAAAAAMAELRDPTQHSRAVSLLAQVELRKGDSDRARRVLTDAVAAMREFGSPYYTAETLAALGDAAHQVGDRNAAISAWTEAADLYAGLGDGKAQSVRDRIGAALDRDPPHRT
ncbi:tetratricopeptide repeat protein [Actinokineospora sp. UTMC 2448]|uniref:tetratricopeptide repeat protein n=1 Tax=Actinokineospora sp. UTMC 2448 TaxID=2268449 RepID=UPI0021646446|nr:tetratricopeptide repeat protein [Actinokineospora sp. UTMC 2448]